MRSTCNSVVVFATLSALSDMISAHAGDLNPPPGPVAPTMKTLSEIEPRIAISAMNTPGDADSLFKITQPGSYYLTGNVAGVSGKMGIEVAVGANGPGVTIDLMGFELAGAPGSLDGIAVTAADARNVAIRGGAIRDWGGDAIDVFNSFNNLLENLRVFGNGARGIIGGPLSIIVDCAVESNALEGIRTFDGSTLTRCTVNNNSGDGIVTFFAGTVTHCTTNFNLGKGIFADDGASVTGCSAIYNGGIGISVSGGSTVTDCSARLNTGDGINAGSNATLTRCTASGNTGDGLVAGNGCTVMACTSDSNSGDGIRVGSASLVIHNNCNANNPLHSGIYTSGSSNRIEGNNLTGSSVGLNVDGSFNFIIRNSARGNTVNYDIAANNRYGQIVNVTNLAAPAVSGNSAASTLTSSDPWANFAY